MSQPRPHEARIDTSHNVLVVLSACDDEALIGTFCGAVISAGEADIAVLKGCGHIQKDPKGGEDPPTEAETLLARPVAARLPGALKRALEELARQKKADVAGPPAKKLRKK